MFDAPTEPVKSSFHVKAKSHVLFSISLIQDEQPKAQTGEEFNKMADDILANPNVEKVTLMLADTLQRFRLMLKKGLTEDEAIAETKKLYAAFLENNKGKIAELKEKKQLEIIDWDYYRNTDEFRKEFAGIEELYKQKNFKSEVNSCVENDIRKLKTELGDKYNNDRAWALMKKYIFEESTFQVVAGNDEKNCYHYEYYKTPRNKAMRYVHNIFIKDKHPDLMREICGTDALKINIGRKSREDNAYPLGANPQAFFVQSLGNENIDNQLLAFSLSIYHLIKTEGETLSATTQIPKAQANTMVYLKLLSSISSNDSSKLTFKYNGTFSNEPDKTTAGTGYRPGQTSTHQ